MDHKNWPHQHLLSDSSCKVLHEILWCNYFQRDTCLHQMWYGHARLRDNIRGVNVESAGRPPGRGVRGKAYRWPVLRREQLGRPIFFLAQEEGEIPANPKKFISDFPNSLLTGLITTPNFTKRSKTICTCLICSPYDELAIKTSSTKCNPCDTWSINLWSDCTVFLKPKGMRRKTNNRIVLLLQF